MKKTLIGFVSVALLVPIAVSAMVTCRDTTLGCSVEQLVELSGSPIVAQSDKIVILHELLQKLTSMITVLLAQKGAMQEGNHSSPSLTCFIPTYDLYIGRTDAETNGEVKKLQLWLKAEGYFPDAQGTGYYGEKTAAAVMKWQKAHGMDFVTLASGVGKQTRVKMQEACGKTVQTLTGEMRYSDMSGFEVFSFSPNESGGIVNRYSFGQGLGGVDVNAHNQIVGSLSPLGDSCTLGIQATIEIADPPTLVKKDDANMTRDYQAQFIRVVSKGPIYDYCATPTGTTKTVRNREVLSTTWKASILDPSAGSYKAQEQSIALYVLYKDGTERKYTIGNAYGCPATTAGSPQTRDGKKLLGALSCYYALSGTQFIAYLESDMLVVERGAESAKDGSVAWSRVLEKTIMQ